MAIFKWTDLLSMSDAVLDDDHRQMINLLDKTYEALKSGEKITGFLLVDVIEHATRHFAAEEAFMEAINYDNLDEHRHEHENIKTVIQMLQSEHASGTDVGLKLMLFLFNWLFNHIMVSDRRLAIASLIFKNAKNKIR